MSAWDSFAKPLMTLIKSKTTRRSAPSTRSRLRNPTSKSTTTTFWPSWARAAPSAAVDVVLPTPPLPDVTTNTWPASAVISPILSALRDLIDRRDIQRAALKPSLKRSAAQVVIDVVRRLGDDTQ